MRPARSPIPPLRASLVPAAVASILLTMLGSCGGTASTHGTDRSLLRAARVVRVDRPAPDWLVHELRHTYEPIQPCPRPCSPIFRRGHDHALLLHRSTALATGALPRAVAEARLNGGETVTIYLYRSQTGQLCDDVEVGSGTRRITGGLTPGLPCVPGRPCRAICLMQLHCCGANLIVGTVTADADELGTTFDDDNGNARYRLDEPTVPHRPLRRFFVLDLRPHDFADPIRLFGHGRVIARASVAGLG